MSSMKLKGGEESEESEEEEEKESDNDWVGKSKMRECLMIPRTIKVAKVLTTIEI
jgi:hypothetical protein